jgi:hypothetical protein
MKDQREIGEPANKDSLHVEYQPIYSLPYHQASVRNINGTLDSKPTVSRTIISSGASRFNPPRGQERASSISMSESSEFSSMTMGLS